MFRVSRFSLVFASSKARIGRSLQEIKDAGLWKSERVINSPQSSHVVTAKKDVINMCANNYLGLANNEEVRAAAQKALDKYGFGCASVRFICGTMTVHKELEQAISKFHGMDDTILYSSCFDANAGLFETVLDAEDAVISDELNHASIIDGIRLCKATRLRYKNSDMGDLEAQLQASTGARSRMIATDGIFSMDGFVAKLQDICALAEKYDAMVMVDESHATGYFGATGRGTPEHCGVTGRVDIITSTLGKSLGGGSGGYITGPAEIVQLLRNRSRPYLFSNSIPPPVAAAGLKVFEMITASDEWAKRTHDRMRYFRTKMEKLGFTLQPGETAIVPVMLGDAALATKFADKMLERGVYVIGFSFPVVPKGKARVRVQVSGGHSFNDLDAAVEAFRETGVELGILKN